MAKKTTTTSKPADFADASIKSGIANYNDNYNAQQPNVAKVQGGINSALDTVSGMQGPSAGLTAATAYNTDTINGKYLNSNPYMDSVINQTNNDVTNKVGSQFEAAGRYGSGAHADILSRNLASADGALRYGNYNDERQRQMQADSLAPAQDEARFNGVQPLLGLSAASVNEPYVGANSYANGINGLSRGYGTNATRTTGLSNAIDVWGNFVQTAAKTAQLAAGAGGGGGGGG
jgi:hypothetical protein